VSLRASAALLGFAVSIDCFASAYRLRRLMLQSHSRTMLLIFAITIAGECFAFPEGDFKKTSDLLIRPVGLMGKNENNNGNEILSELRNAAHK
jgi:hypothetical protein